MNLSLFQNLLTSFGCRASNRKLKKNKHFSNFLLFDHDSIILIFQMSHLLEVSIAYRHCVKSVCIRSHSGPHFSTFSLIWTEYEEIDWIHIYSKCGKCGKMRTRITPNTDTFYVVRGIFRSVQYISDGILQKYFHHGSVTFS